MNYVILVSRILVDYFDSFNVSKDVCVRHIPHKYSQEMSVKSRKVKLPLLTDYVLLVN